MAQRLTVADLAEEIDTRRRAGPAVPLPELRPVARDGDLPLSFSQQRMWFLQQLQPGSSAYNIPVAVRLKGSLNVNALEDSLNQIRMAGITVP